MSVEEETVVYADVLIGHSLVIAILWFRSKICGQLQIWTQTIPKKDIGTKNEGTVRAFFWEETSLTLG